MTKPVILTGLRANNDLHIGNYFGALLPLVDMAKNRADDYEINLFVPDLHSFTTPVDHAQLQKQVMHNLKLFAAAGLPLDHPNIHIYRQSYVPAHSELTWILDNFTGYGEMSRMTQFKDKSGVQNVLINNAPDIVAYRRYLAQGQPLDTADIGALLDYFDILEEHRTSNMRKQDRVSVGLFNYPVLMAADILLYGASYVPVGDDQSQHLEFARDIAMRLNNRFGELFVVPKPVKEQHTFFGKDQGLRIKDLVDPTKKMSKSNDSGRGIIFLGDAPADAAAKIKAATTDSLGHIDPAGREQPGIYNLLQMLALVTGRPTTEVTDEFYGQLQYGPLKQTVAAAVSSFLTEFQNRLSQVDEARLQSKLEADEKQMNMVANETLLKVQKAVGLRP